MRQSTIRRNRRSSAGVSSKSSVSTLSRSCAVFVSGEWTETEPPSVVVCPPGALAEDFSSRSAMEEGGKRKGVKAEFEVRSSLGRV